MHIKMVISFYLRNFCLIYERNKVLHNLLIKLDFKSYRKYVS